MFYESSNNVANVIIILEPKIIGVEKGGKSITDILVIYFKLEHFPLFVIAYFTKQIKHEFNNLSQI